MNGHLVFGMTPHTLLERIQTPNADYVEAFQALARVNLAMRQHGATTERLLCKAILEMDVGNFAAGLQAAEDALVMDVTRAEAHYQAAIARILMAMVRAGALTAAPGSDLPTTSVSDYLEEARHALAETVQLAPHDEEAQDDLEALEEFLENHGDESARRDALTDQAVCC